MTKFDHWPMWLQLLIGLPHAMFLAILLWIWWPKTVRDWLFGAACFAYFVLFYFVFVR
jgi:hypothetical protein